MNKRLKKKRAKQGKYKKVIGDCSKCSHAVGLFYDNTGTCEKNLFLGECDYEPIEQKGG